jgi:ABC-type transport system substrate-binding protein
MLNQVERNSQLNVGLPYAWGEIIPPLQHTAYGDLIIGNIFEPLVKMNERGIVVPAAAKSWQISDDFRQITFKIDTKKRFANGIFLSAQHFKESWEKGLSMTPQSNKSSLADSLYIVEGMENFHSSQSLSGVKVVDDETLIVNFAKPTRMGLEYLSGGRTAAYLVEQGAYLGTGPYKISAQSKSEIILTKNPFSADGGNSDKINIIDVSGNDDHEIDVYYALGTDILPKGLRNEPINILNGFEYSHIIISLNGLEQSLFSRRKFRQALQYLVFKQMQDPSIRNQFVHLKLDPMVFLPFQPGSLKDDEVKKMINEGAQYVPALIEESRKRPLKFLKGASIWFVIQRALAKEGINFDKSMELVPFSEIVKTFYKKHDVDMIGHSASVLNGDPDGIYHLLGKNGAITSPMIQRPRVAELLEEGRKIMKHEELNAPYQEVSRAILEEVPFVHFGFSYAKIYYNSETIETDAGTVQREMHEFAQFRKK